MSTIDDSLDSMTWERHKKLEKYMYLHIGDVCSFIFQLTAVCNQNGLIFSPSQCKILWSPVIYVTRYAFAFECCQALRPLFPSPIIELPRLVSFHLTFDNLQRCHREHSSHCCADFILPSIHSLNSSSLTFWPCLSSKFSATNTVRPVSI